MSLAAAPAGPLEAALTEWTRVRLTEIRRDRQMARRFVDPGDWLAELAEEARAVRRAGYTDHTREASA